MRFTVKAKLASAFGAVIVLSMITGGVAYNSSLTLTEQQERIVGQAIAQAGCRRHERDPAQQRPRAA